MQEDNVSTLEMASRNPEILNAIIDISNGVFDREIYRQWLLQIGDINLLCLLKIQ